MKKPIPFGRYYLMDRVAVGGMAEVFKAKSLGAEGFSKVVALKRILPNIAEDQEFITMFIDEAKIAVQLSHANVARILELGEDRGTYFIAMEYIQGKDLRTIFERAKRTEDKSIAALMAAYIISRVCEGLDYAHRKKDDTGKPLCIVHRDVSPQNILVSFDGDVKLIDFGVAKAQNKITRTQAGILKGKFSYMSPEQVQGLPLDQRSDIFGLGIVLHEMLVGQRLFVGKSDFQTLEKVRKAEAVKPSEINPNIPPELDEITMRALSRDPNTRYTYASEMHEDLQRFLYSRSPVYSRKNLSSYMHEVFGEDLTKELQRQTAYDPFFTALQNGTLPPDAAVAQPNAYAPTGTWNAASGNPPALASGQSYNGAPPARPQEISYSGSGPHPVQYHQNSVAQPIGAFAGQPHQQAPNAFGQQPQLQPRGLYQAPPAPPLPAAYNRAHPDAAESTMLEQSGQGFLTPGGVVNPIYSQPQLPAVPMTDAQGMLTGDHLPNAPLQQELSAHNFIDSLEEEEGESDTIIDISMGQEVYGGKSGGKKGWVIAAIISLFVLLTGTAVFLMKDKLLGPPPQPVKPEKGKYYVVFADSSKGVKFLYNGTPFTSENIDKADPKRVLLRFDKPGLYWLELRKAGFQTIKSRINVKIDQESETPPIQMVQQAGFLKIETDPPEAVVKVNGVIQSKATPATYKLLAGVHSIRVVTKGRKPWSQKVTIKPKGLQKFKLKLEKMKYATLQVLCHNKGTAKVYINGRYKGKVDSSPKNFKLRFARTHRLKVIPVGYEKLMFRIARLAFPIEPLHIVKVNCVPPSSQRKQKGFITINSQPPSAVQINQAQINRGAPITRAKIPLSPGRYTFTFTHPKTKKQQKMDVDINEGNNPDIVVTWR